MQPFEVNVLDRRRTLTEKLVSLLRCSLADNYMSELTAKIRHFYDLHFLLNDVETQDYLKSDVFKSDFSNLFAQDQQRFDKPEGWQNKNIMDSPIINDLHDVWSALSLSLIHIYFFGLLGKTGEEPWAFCRDATGLR